MLTIADATTWWDEAVKQAPALVVLAWIVWKFLAHMRDDRIAREQHAERREEAIAQIGDKCHAFQERTMVRMDAMVSKTDAALAANTRSLDTNTRALERFEQTVANAAVRQGGG